MSSIPKKAVLQVLFHLLMVIPTVFYAKSTLSGSGFKENKGQVIDQYGKANPEVLFLYSTGNFRLQLRKTGFSYEISSATNAPSPGPRANKNARSGMPAMLKINNHRVDVEFEEMNPAATLQAEDPITGLDNYYTPGGAATNVVSYNKVTYYNLYPHTDIEFITDTTTENGFKYNIILKPGADINAVKLLIEGSTGLRLSANGSLLIGTSLGSISESIPVSYYEAYPKQTVQVNFKLNNSQLTLAGNYDKTKTLIIDPVSNLIWATYYGSTDVDYCNSAAVDGQNNLYIAGYTNSTSNIATSGIHQSVLSAGFDAYVVKFNSAGTRLWGTYLGGPGVDVFYAIYVENNGTVYVCGDTSSQSGVTSLGAFQSVYGGGIDDVLLAKFNNSGQRLWSTYLGGSEHDIAQALTVDNAGNVIITGHTQSTLGIATAGAYNTTYNLNYDVFVSKFSSLGAQIWGSYYGDSGVDEAYGIAHDAGNNIIITGATQSIAGLATGLAHQFNFGGAQDAFLAKFNASGTALTWATYFGGVGLDSGNDVEIDNQGNIYICGTTTSSNNIVTSGAFQTVQGSYDDSFLGAFTASGARTWCTYYGGEDTDYIYDLVLDSKQNLLFCGATVSTFSISTPGAYQPSLTAIYYYDAYFAKFTNTGNRILSTYFGGEGNDYAKGMAIDNLGKIYLAGETTSTASISTPGTHQSAYSGSTDAFVAKFCIPFVPKITPAGNATICLGATTLSAAPGFSTYLWNTTYTINPLIVNSTSVAGNYSFVLVADDGYGCQGISDTTYIHAQSCVGLEEQSETEDLQIYPNPARDQIILESASGTSFELEIINLLGTIILRDKAENGKFSACVEQLPKGVYLVRILSGSLLTEKKFIKD